MTEFYKQKIEDVLKSFKVDPDKGLGVDVAKKRLETYGKNNLESAKKINPIKLFFSQFKDVLVIVLIISAGVSFTLSILEEDGTPTDSVLIFMIVIAIAIIGFLNEYRAEKTVEALMKLVGSTAKVRRGGKVLEISTSEVVPGDIVLLEEGAKVPADLRLIKVKNLAVNESSLTGESIPVTKKTFAINETSTLGDQKNMVFSGTIITVGKGEGVVVSTANNTEIGKIATMVSEVNDELTPMQEKLDDLGRKIGAIVLAVSIFVFVVIFFLDKDIQDDTVIQKLILSFTAAVALAVAAIPEGLAFVVRISLALGAKRMAAKNALVRRLSAVEALGSTDVVCSDKTGTLTKGEMTVREIYFSQELYEVSGSGYKTEGSFTLADKVVEEIDDLQSFLLIGLLNNNAQINNEIVIGDPTEAALIVSAEKSGIEQKTENLNHKRVEEVPFSSDRKMMSTVHEHGDNYFIAAKGSTDAILDKCNRILINGSVINLSSKHIKEIHKQTENMAGKALRVLAFAYKEVKSIPENDEAIESVLIFAGLQGMMDPPRNEVKEVIHRVTAEAGMRVLMITGDHILTAKAVAREIGIVGDSISGTEIDTLTQEEFENRVEKISVYARVNPEHKIRIVEALKKHGHQVAMTGDGVNDAPAIKAADIGIAMGINGTDAAKEAADLILLDDQFLTIINAIEEGRGIFDNVRKFVNYLLSANIAEVLTVLGGIVFLGRLVVSASQLLFINIVTDGLPAVALGSDPSENGVMRFKPNKFQEAIVNKRMWVEMLIFGFLMTFAILGHYYWIANSTDDITRAGSVAFSGMVIYEMARLINIRSGYNIRWLSNPWLSVAIAGSLVLLLLVLYIPVLSDLFKIVPIEPIDWAIILVLAFVMVIMMKLVDRLLDNLLNDAKPQFSPAHYGNV